MRSHPSLAHRFTPGLATLAFVLAALPVSAQTSVSLIDFTPYVENFDDLTTAFPVSGGLGPTFPTATSPAGTVLIQPGLTVAMGATVDFAPGGVLTIGGSNTLTNSLRAMQDSAGEYAFGGKLGATATLTGRFTNDTGATVAEWDVAYDIERYSFRNSTTATTVSFSYSSDGVIFFPFGTGFSFAAAPGDLNPANNFLSTVATTAFAQRVPFAVADGSSIHFRWTFVDPAADGRHVAIDNLVVTAIPEPAAGAALLGAAVLGLTLARRRFLRR